LIVEFQTAVKRQMIIHLERQIHRAGDGPGLEDGNHGTIRGCYIDGGQLLLQNRHVRHGADRRGGHRRQYLPFGEIARAADVDFMQSAFGNLQAHDLIRDILLGNIGEHRGEAVIVVSFFERRSGDFNVGERLMVAEQGVQDSLDIPIGQYRVSHNAIFMHVEASCRRRLFGGRRCLRWCGGGCCLH
jgi:hypothetical protein